MCLVNRDHSFLYMDPTQICVRNAGVAKASLTCFSLWLLFRKRCLQLMFIIQKTISPICPPPLWLPSSVLLHSFNLHCASLVSWICPPSRSFPLSTSHRTISFLLHFPPCNLPLLSPLCFPLSCQAQLSKVRKKTSNVSSGNFNLDQPENGAYKKAKGTSSFNSSKKERNDAHTCLMILSDTTEELEVDPEIEPEEEPELYSEHHCSLNNFFFF